MFVFVFYVVVISLYIFNLFRIGVRDKKFFPFFIGSVCSVMGVLTAISITTAKIHSYETVPVVKNEIGSLVYIDGEVVESNPKTATDWYNADSCYIKRTSYQNIANFEMYNSIDVSLSKFED